VPHAPLCASLPGLRAGVTRLLADGEAAILAAAAGHRRLMLTAELRPPGPDRPDAAGGPPPAAAPRPSRGLRLPADPPGGAPAVPAASGACRPGGAAGPTPPAPDGRLRRRSTRGTG
jgi:hypothetical protein